MLDTFLDAYRTTPNSTLPQQRCPAELFFGRKHRTTLDLPPKEPTGRFFKMERQFTRRHGAVPRYFNTEDPFYARHRRSQDWDTGSVARQIGGRLYEVTMSDGTSCRFQANQLRPRIAWSKVGYYAAFADAFNLPFTRPQAPNEEGVDLIKPLGDNDQGAGHQGNVAVDNVDPERPEVEPQVCSRNFAVLNEVKSRNGSLNWIPE
jgi:hypothetical protein